MIAAGPAGWTVFWTAVAVLLVIDIAAARGSARSLRTAALWSALWIGLSLLFGAWVAVRFGREAGLTWLTAYVLEKSLSVDNLFVFAVIFSQTGLSAALQRRALFWGVAGALVMRAVLIALGLTLLARYHWVIYPFAALLVFAAARMLWGEDKERKLAEATCSLCSSWIARFVPITPVSEGSRFLARKGGRLYATPLLVALVAIETTDLLFAVDSIPAVFAVTRDPFLVYTSNVFALLGLRSLYFVLAGAIARLRFLQAALAVMLLLVAAKMLLGDALEMPPGASLAVIAGIFAAAVAASLLFPGRAAGREEKAMTVCTHRDQIKDVGPNTRGCEECLELGESWVQLRLCLACGHVGCCDSSRNKHATGHFHATGHAVMRSIEPGESWKWCYVDKTMVD